MLRLTVCTLALAVALTAQTFRRQVIDSALKGGYQVVVADVNGDGKPDLLAVASGQTDLVWYENPAWTRHVMATGLERAINAAAKDIDGDGIPEIALAYEFSNEARKSAGIIAILRHTGDPRNLWKLQEIDRLPTSHRLRWMRMSGKDILVNAPLTAASAEPPDYQGRVPLVFYRPGEWKRETIDAANEGVQHGIFVLAAAGGAPDQLLTASFSGIDRYQSTAGKWERHEIARGDPSPCPKCGASDVTIGRLNGEQFLASIEPWHGNQVVAYTKSNRQWTRSVIDEAISDGHTILMADITGGGHDEIVVGFRGNGGGVRMYAWVRGAWRTRVIEDGAPAASCAAADLSGSGRVDLVCIGGTQLTLYRFSGDR